MMKSDEIALAIEFMADEFKRVGYVQNDDDAKGSRLHRCNRCDKPAYVGLRCLQCGAPDDRV